MNPNDPEPLYAYKFKRADSIFLAAIASIFLLLTLLQILYIDAFNTLFNNLLTISVTSFLFVLFIYLLVFFRKRIRAEFYDSFVRLYPRWQKEGVDVKYSDLNVKWAAQGGFTVCILSIKDNVIGEGNGKRKRQTWRLVDINGKNTDKTLFMWLQSKIGVA